MVKVMSVFGTRPEAIKMAPLCRALERSEHTESIVCVTGQHRAMLDMVLEMFSITPDFDLDIMKEKQSLVDITNRVTERLSAVLEREKPDIVLVHGDTTTTFAGALAAYYNKIPVGHVEAGLRTFDKYSPYPEEMNRTLTTHLADLHFAPTAQNKKNLLDENVSEDGIFVTGNTVIDALSTTVNPGYESEVLNRLDKSKRTVLLTAHRRENLGEPLRRICRAVARLAADFPDIEIVYPMHLNPLVRVEATNILGSIKNVRLIEPLEVLDMHNLMARCELVLTDSGGLQEEAPALSKPVLVLRDTTERPEAVAAGTVKLCGTDEDEIYKNAATLLSDADAYAKMAKAANPYGDGKAGDRIVDAILYYFGLIPKRPKDFA